MTDQAADSDNNSPAEPSYRKPRIEVVDRVYAAILAAKTPAERIAMVGDAHRTARILVEAGIRHRNPSWTDAEISGEASRRLLGGPD